MAAGRLRREASNPDGTSLSNLYTVFKNRIALSLLLFFGVYYVLLASLLLMERSTELFSGAMVSALAVFQDNLSIVGFIVLVLLSFAINEVYKRLRTVEYYERCQRTLFTICERSCQEYPGELCKCQLYAICTSACQQLELDLGEKEVGEGWALALEKLPNLVRPCSSKGDGGYSVCKGADPDGVNGGAQSVEDEKHSEKSSECEDLEAVEMPTQDQLRRREKRRLRKEKEKERQDQEREEARQRAMQRKQEKWLRKEMAAQQHKKKLEQAAASAVPVKKPVVEELEFEELDFSNALATTGVGKKKKKSAPLPQAAIAAIDKAGARPEADDGPKLAAAKPVKAKEDAKPKTQPQAKATAKQQQQQAKTPQKAAPAPESDGADSRKPTFGKPTFGKGLFSESCPDIPRPGRKQNAASDKIPEIIPEGQQISAKEAAPAIGQNKFSWQNGSGAPAGSKSKKTLSVSSGDASDSDGWTSLSGSTTPTNVVAESAVTGSAIASNAAGERQGDKAVPQVSPAKKQSQSTAPVPKQGQREAFTAPSEPPQFMSEFFANTGLGVGNSAQMPPLEALEPEMEGPPPEEDVDGELGTDGVLEDDDDDLNIEDMVSKIISGDEFHDLASLGLGGVQAKNSRFFNQF